jgi:glycosyltransferase involved in cell wall biosynthesis
MVTLSAPGPRIPPLTQEDRSPFWSVMIPARDCSESIGATLESVLANDIDPIEMEVQVVDDCSTDVELESLVSSISAGRVTYFRHAHPLGAPRVFNSCIRRARGRWIHLLHADDIVLPGFYRRLRAAIEADEGLGAAFSRCHFVDESGRRLGMSALERSTPGVLQGYARRLATANRIRAPSIVVRRHTYEDLGGFRAAFGHAADWEMWIRIATKYAFHYEPTPLVCYRIHSKSDTARLARSGANIADAARAVRSARELLPDSDHDIATTALSALGQQALETSRAFLRSRDVEAAFAQLREGIRCIHEVATLRAAVVLLAAATRTAARDADLAKADLPLEAWRIARQRAVDLLLATPPDILEQEYLGTFRAIQREIERSGLADAQPTRDEEQLLATIQESIRSSPFSPYLASRILSTALYRSRSALVQNEAGRRARDRLEPVRERASSVRTAAWTIIVRALLRIVRLRQPAVAVAVGAYHPRLRGDASHARWIASELRERGYFAVVVAPRALGQPLLVDRIPVVPTVSIVRSCDVVLTYSVNDTTRACGLELAAARRPCWIHHPCTMTGGDLAERADRILALSSWDERVATAAGREPSHVTRVRPAAHSSRRARRRDFRSRFGIEGDYLVWAGAWLHAKGVRHLCERYVLFCNRHPGFGLHLVMFGGYGRREFPLAHPRVIVLDGNARDLPAALADCLFVAFNSPAPPAGYDATPLILLEGLMHGKTFVAQAGTPLLDEIGQLGIIVRSDNEWLDAVESLVFDPEKRESLERACRAAYRRSYNFDQMMAGLDRSLRELLMAGRRGG